MGNRCVSGRYEFSMVCVYGEEEEETSECANNKPNR